MAEQELQTVVEQQFMAATVHQKSTTVELIRKALQIAGTPERLAEWLEMPLPALDGETPFAMLQSEAGRARLLDVLGQIEHGIF